MDLNTLNSIARIQYYKNVVVVELGNAKMLSRFQYNVLQTEDNGRILPCRKVIRDDRMNLVYMGNAAVKLADSSISAMSAEEKIDLVGGLLEAFRAVDRHDYLSPYNIMLDEKLLYYDAAEKKIRFMYVPLSYDRGYEVFYSEMIRMLDGISVVTGLGSDLNQDWNDFTAWIRGNLYPLDEIVAGINRITGKGSEDEKDPGNGLTIRSMNLQPPIEIHVDKDVFTIGRSSSAVDGLLAGLSTVSGKHCEFVLRDGQYYVRDLVSTNGTYVNSEKLKRGEIVPVSSGDIIKIADHPFIVE